MNEITTTAQIDDTTTVEVTAEVGATSYAWRVMSQHGIENQGTETTQEPLTREDIEQLPASFEAVA